MAKLIIKRSSEFNNILRDIEIHLNGRKIGTIENGELKEFVLEAGNHQLKAKIDWCGSQTLNLHISENETQSIQLSGFTYGKWFTPLYLAILAFFIGLKLLLGFSMFYLVLISLPALAVLIYYFTFGRNKYLHLEKQ